MNFWNFRCKPMRVHVISTPTTFHEIVRIINAGVDISVNVMIFFAYE